MGDAKVLVNGRFLTMDERRRSAAVVVVRDGRIAEVGDAGLEAAHPDAVRVDLGGRWVTPGFIDAHHHLSMASLHARWGDLAGITEVGTVAGILRDAAAHEPDAPWVRAAAWDGENTSLRLTRHELDEVGLDRPVIVGCFSYHRCVVSSAGLDALGISASTPDPPGGRIERDERGEPTGVLVETAWTAAHTASLVGYDDPDRWGELIEARALGLLAEGITAVHDAACPPEAEAVYRALAAAGRLPLSVLVMPHGPILGGPDLGRLDRGPVTGEGDEWVRVGPVKLFADGGIDLDIDAHFGDVHVDRRGGFPDTAAQAAAAVQRGYGLAIHAMGNRALRSAIDAWRIATADREPAHPCRIEHVSLAGIDEVAAMRDLGITGVVQPAFVDLIGQTVGNFRFDDATWLPFADLLAAGVPLAASSDGPCQFTDPLLSTFHGVTRLTRGGVEVGPDQAVPFLEWLRLYTAGAAEAGGQADERGRLRPGLVADFVVLDGDVEVASRSADAVVVAETWVAGERVHSA